MNKIREWEPECSKCGEISIQGQWDTFAWVCRKCLDAGVKIKSNKIPGEINTGKKTKIIVKTEKQVEDNMLREAKRKLRGENHG